MNYRRGYRSLSSRRFPARRRFRSTTRKVARGQTWEKATIFISRLSEFGVGGNALNLAYFPLISIANSFGTTTSASTEQRIGTMLTQVYRSAEVGGIVYDWGFQFLPNAGVNADLLPADFADCVTGLMVDRQYSIDQNGGPLPASISSWDPFTPQFPFATLQNSTPIVNNDAVNSPEKILLQKSWRVHCGVQPIVNVLEGELVYPLEQPVNLKKYGGTVNKRLRLRLSDEQALYLFICHKTGPAFAAGSLFRDYQFWVRGTLYYRFRS